MTGGVLSTAGDLVFQGSGSRELVAYHARTGERLWAADVGVGIIAPPVTYSVAGEQYVVDTGHLVTFDEHLNFNVRRWPVGRVRYSVGRAWLSS